MTKEVTEEPKETINPYVTDYWAFGIVMYAMLVGDFPFKGPSNEELYRQIKEDPLIFPEHVSFRARDILTRLLIKDPKSRLGCNSIWEIQNDAFFEGVEWGKIRNSELEAQNALRSQEILGMLGVDQRDAPIEMPLS